MKEELILSEIRTLKEFFIKEFDQNKSDHEKMKKEIENTRDQHELRLRSIEDWKLVFVTKYTVYSAIALFLGSIISTVAFQFLNKYI